MANKSEQARFKKFLKTRSLWQEFEEGFTLNKEMSFQEYLNAVPPECLFRGSFEWSQSPSGFAMWERTEKDWLTIIG